MDIVLDNVHDYQSEVLSVLRSWDIHFNVKVQDTHPDIVSLTAKCHALASVIGDIPITPSMQQRIDSLNILRAVRGTTGIEGTDVSEEEVREIINAPLSKSILAALFVAPLPADKLVRYVARLLHKIPNCSLSEDLIYKLHEITTQNIDYPHNVPGRYRTFPVTAGEYIPPREEVKIRELMKHFISWFNEREPTGWDPIIQAIVGHFYVISIHPFGDGNGRTSRAVESFLLYKAGINARGFYSLANYYYQERDKYEQFLDKVRFETDGDLTPFILFALQGLASELEWVHREVLSGIKRIAFRDLSREMLSSNKITTKSGGRMLNFLLVLGDELVSVRDIRQGKHRLSSIYNNLTEKTLSRDINYLKEKELIMQDNGNIRTNIEYMDRFTPPHELIR